MMTRLSVLFAMTCSLGCLAGPRGERVVYLDFADGHHGVIKGDVDDATRNVSKLCGVEAFAAWKRASGCSDRASCVDAIRARVEGYYARYDLRFVTARPPPGSVYTTIVIAPPEGDCSFGRRGVADVDCGDANPANIGFVFDCTDVDSCAVLVAHETAHTFGLVHVTAPNDIMTLAPEDPQSTFETPEHPTTDDVCNTSAQSSHETLLRTLGPR